MLIPRYMPIYSRNYQNIKGVNLCSGSRHCIMTSNLLTMTSDLTPLGKHSKADYKPRVLMIIVFIKLSCLIYIFLHLMHTFIS